MSFNIFLTANSTKIVIGIVEESDVLNEYIATGNRLKESLNSGIAVIESGITEFVNDVKKCQNDRPAMFAYLDGSSGLGKTQLAFALKRKVLYLPQGM